MQRLSQLPLSRVQKTAFAPVGRTFLLFAFLVVSTLQAQAWAQASAPGVDPLIERREVNAWLNKIHRAAQVQNYVGTFVFQRGSTMRSSKISHYADRGNEYEELETLDGRQRRILRHNEDLYTLLPEQKTVYQEKRESKDSFPALLATPGRDVLDYYDPKMLPSERMAGFDCIVIELSAKDAYRFGYRLWADRNTGLLLRAQTLDPDGHLLEQAAFSQINIGVPSEKSRIVNAIHGAQGWHVVRPQVQAGHIADAGWTINANVPGFKAVREVRRTMHAGADGAPLEVQQVVYSDGMAGLSVFIEPATRDRKEGHGSAGATNILIKRYGNFWLTLLGEVPQATLQQFAANIDYKPGK
ncbi:MucB/RseB C-terminal domain-containing protein [Pandoraea terrae]|uniref:MucB/RseB C-terminal domain-containing protein n=1 Tax=Pandoraea terrae TaxID=1537710 RepID=UPI003B83781C